MKNGFALTTLLAAALAAPALSYADDTRWDSLRVYDLSSGSTVAIAVPSEWSPIEASRNVGKSPLRFQDMSGAVVAIPVAALERAAADKRVFRPDFSRRVARNER